MTYVLLRCGYICIEVTACVQHVHEINPCFLYKTRYESLLEGITITRPLHWSSSSVILCGTIHVVYFCLRLKTKEH